VTSAQDILDALGTLHTQGEAPLAAVARDVPEAEGQEKVVWQALGSEARHVDELARSLGIGAGEISGSLAMLELSGLARQVGPMLYTRA
jgi:DNA processing protein